MQTAAILSLARRNQERARQVIADTGLIRIWESVGAEIHPVGSLRTGLLATHLDIDFHIYTDTLSIEESFRAASLLAARPGIVKLEYINLIDTPEQCIEWHARYQEIPGSEEYWQIDMIHLLRGSKYDGYFERVADRIAAVLTPETRDAILALKYETPADEKIPGIFYCKAVLADGIRTWPRFQEWLRKQPEGRILEWMP